MKNFQRYKKLLNKISDVCAQGYPLDWTDQKVITGNLKKDVDEFLVFLKSKKKTDYDASPEKMATSALTISTLIELMDYILFAFSTASSMVPTM